MWAIDITATPFEQCSEMHASVREIVTFVTMKFAQCASDIATLSQLRNI